MRTVAIRRAAIARLAARAPVRHPQPLMNLRAARADAGNASVGRIKKKFDEKWSPYWHVVVGRSYGAFATHETRHFCSFKVDNFAVMMYKTA